ncbi:MAG: IS4 family transposase [Spirulinaceae cyanobacterium]
MVSNFPGIVKKYLGGLPKDDYPALNTFLFVSTWLSFVLDQGQVSMRSLFKTLNIRGIKVDKSTFSRASKKRDPMLFYNLFKKLRKELNKSKKIDKRKLALFPLDSTIVTLTSKLLTKQGFKQVKLFSGLNLLTSSPEGILIHFGQGHDSKYGNYTIEANPENGVSLMDRGFSGLSRIKSLLSETNKYFLLRIKKNISIQMLENGNYILGKGKEQVEVRVVVFCDLETRTEFRLATNLPEKGEEGMSNQEIGELYRLRWQIELFWKFLKMHLKLDNLITKNTNGIEIQIYSCLIGYVLLAWVKIPQEFGNKLLDKLRYLQAFMTEHISYVHWFKKLVFT